MVDGDVMSDVGPEDGENPNKDTIIEDIVLAFIHCCMQKMEKETVHLNAKKGFPLEDICAAAGKLSVVGHLFVERKGKGIRSKVDLILDDILDVLYRLDDNVHMPKILVNIFDLAKMPVIPVRAGATEEVSTRLDNVERGIINLREAVENMTFREERAPIIPTINTPGAPASISGIITGDSQGSSQTYSSVAGGSGS